MQFMSKKEWKKIAISKWRFVHRFENAWNEDKSTRHFMLRCAALSINLNTLLMLIEASLLAGAIKISPSCAWSKDKRSITITNEENFCLQRIFDEPVVITYYSLIFVSLKVLTYFLPSYIISLLALWILNKHPTPELMDARCQCWRKRVINVQLNISERLNGWINSWVWVTENNNVEGNCWPNKKKSSKTLLIYPTFLRHFLLLFYAFLSLNSKPAANFIVLCNNSFFEYIIKSEFFSVSLKSQKYNNKKNYAAADSRRTKSISHGHEYWLILCFYISCSFNVG